MQSGNFIIFSSKSSDDRCRRTHWGACRSKPITQMTLAGALSLIVVEVKIMKSLFAFLNFFRSGQP
ncbi:hypothetical protein Syun_006528 [Stephania yunnanensis]|uniref:Uncharacterized protein n=1 Tax=Stephania yunnanensis TaxID=152371 RepID=A0AAP0KYF2_9MAGN